MKKDYKALGNDKISTLLLSYSLPAMVGMIVNSLYNIVDRIFIGNAPNIGYNGLVAITIAYPNMLITNAIGILFELEGLLCFL